MNQEKINKTPEKQKTPNYTLRRLGAAGGLLAASTVLWLGVTSGPKSLEFSTNTDVWSAQPNEGLDSAVNHVKILDADGNILDLNNIDYRRVTDYIRHMPENEEVLSDNTVQIGESFEIPASVTVN